MTKKQKNKLLGVIRKYATITSRLEYRGEYCVVGGMLQECGIDARDIAANYGNGVDSIPYSARSILMAEFGTNRNHLCHLIGTNDKHSQTCQRRLKLTEYVSDFPETPEERTDHANEEDGRQP